MLILIIKGSPPAATTVLNNCLKMPVFPLSSDDKMVSNKKQLLYYVNWKAVSVSVAGIRRENEEAAVTSSYSNTANKCFRGFADIFMPYPLFFRIFDQLAG